MAAVMMGGLDCGSNSPSGSNIDASVAPDLPSAAEAGAGEVQGALPPYCTNKTALASVTDLSGTWVARITGAEVVNAPVVGVMHNQTVLYLLVNISQQGTVLSADGRYCDRIQVNAPGAIAPVVIPNAWAYTESPVHRPGTFAIGADGFPVLTFSPVVEVIGAELADPALDPLPTTTSDPRVYDEDNDTNPGITIVLSGQLLAGSLYTVQRQTTSVSAVAVAPGRIEGAVNFTTEQNVLASKPDSLAVLYSQGGSGADPILCNSGFVMVKIGDAQTPDGGGPIDGGGISCDWVRANETVLFP
jgi:hypothetical protein